MSILACMIMAISKACRTDDPRHTCGTCRHAVSCTHTHRHTRPTSLEIISGLSAPYMRSTQENLSPRRSLFTCPLLLSPFKRSESLSKAKKILLDHGNMNMSEAEKKRSVFFFLNSDGETAKHSNNFRCCEQNNSGTQTNLALSPLSRGTVSPRLFTADDGAPSAGCLVLLVSSSVPTLPPGGLSCYCKARLCSE